MKYVKMAEGAAGLFGKKVEVVLESAEGTPMGILKVEETMIPETFNKPLVIEMGNRMWRILGAKTIREKSILRARKVSLKVVEVDRYKDDQHFLAPTLAHPHPDVSEESGQGDLLFLSNEEWRQFEFLPATMNAVMQEELSAVEKILSPEISPEPLLGYLQVHHRTAIGKKMLSISLDEFCSLLQQDVSGNILLDQQLVADSFVVRTDNNIYYGIEEAGIIKELCLYNYESVDDEFMLITSTFDLVLADWCNAAYIFIDLNAKEDPPVTDPNDNLSII